MGLVSVVDGIFLLTGFYCGWTDYQKGKIYNWATMPAFFIGLAFSFSQGQAIFFDSLLGVALIFLIFFPLFLFKIMGAGDAKLAMVFATVLTWQVSMKMLFISFFIGGTASLFILVFRGKFLGFFKKVYKSFVTLVTPDMGFQGPEFDRNLKAPFGIPIFTSFLIVRYWMAA